MLPVSTTDPFRSLTFDQYDALTNHLEDAQHAIVLISEVLSAQGSAEEDAHIATRTMEALIDRAAAVERHLNAIETLIKEGGA